MVRLYPLWSELGQISRSGSYLNLKSGLPALSFEVLWLVLQLVHLFGCVLNLVHEAGGAVRGMECGPAAHVRVRRPPVLQHSSQRPLSESFVSNDVHPDDCPGVVGSWGR
jgi:hypothetical protein